MADVLRGGIVINEIHAQPVAGAGGFDTDGNGSVSPLDEYIEFHNTGNAPIDLGGLQLWDPGIGNWFTFPPLSILPPGGYAIVVTAVQPGGTLPAADLAFSVGRGGALINNAGDNVFVVDPVANTYIQAGFGDWPLIDPMAPVGAPGSTAGLAGFPATAVRVGLGEHFGAIIAGESIQRAPDGGNTFVNASGETPGASNVCFCAGTLIATATGEIAIERLRPGHRLVTKDAGPTTLRWVGAKRLDHATLAADPRLWPITLAPGALGTGRPKRALRVSPQHRILVTGPIARRMFGATEVLVPAQALLDLPGVSRTLPDSGVTYLHLMCDDHQVIEADGAFAETLYLGPVARQALGPAALREILTLFPMLADTARPKPARVLVSAVRAANLARRHAQNRRVLQPCGNA